MLWLPCRRAEASRAADIIEQERRKLLAEAAELQEYLPKGVLRDKADLEYVTQTFSRTHLNGGVGGNSVGSRR